MKRFIILLSVLSFAFLFESTAQRKKKSTQSSSVFNADIYQGLKWRNIGPYRGGRSNAITGVPHNDQLYYAGYTGGGVWKTEDAGANWENISDGFFSVGSIGDIAVSNSDQNVIWVGTGEHAVRGVTTSYGNGVYRSLDAGATWQHMGLDDTRHISDVLIHPANHDIVWVGAQGAVHGPSKDRGVYKSTDGGKTWTKTLFVDENTGVSSLVMDKTNPRILYAATWQHRRYPWKVESGGPGSSVYKSTDGGVSWKKIDQGLPDVMGKIGISVSPVNPDRVFAIVEAEKSVSGLYRSDDAGQSWKLLSNDQTITARSWYYMEVFADTKNENLVYVLNAPLMRSIDGGKTFESMRVIHGDCHDFWINPENPNNMAMGEDGGATITFNAGKTWSTFNNQPTSQIYRITADEKVPYWVYGGQQDNMSVAIPTRTRNYGILSTDWHNGPGCESAMVAFDDPKNPQVLYGGCYNGNISWLDVKTREAKNIMPYPMTNLAYEPKDMKYRFNWNAPLINSPHDPSVMYYGGNVVFKTTNGGINWEVISPDLTRNDVSKQGPGGGPLTNEGAGGENYNTVYYLAESPHEQGVIYAGTDGGLIQLTRDGGKTWSNITPEGLPETMIHAIEVSPHDKGTVYFASTRYKFNDMRNYSYKSTDYGKTWSRIGDDIQKDDFFRVIREDKKVKGLLYAGAERGFYISFNGGKSFDRLQLNLPVVPVNDITIRDNDLAIATNGRSFWVLDDLSAIQQSSNQFQGEFDLYEPKAHYRFLGVPGFFLISEFGYGENPQEGIHLDYYLKNIGEKELKLEILDENDVVLRTIEGKTEDYVPKPVGGRGNVMSKNTEQLPMKEGINRFTWDFRVDGLIKIPETFVFGADYRGHRVAPGKYKARMSFGAEVKTVDLMIKNPPHLDVPESAWNEQQDLLTELEKSINEIHGTINQSMDLSDRLSRIKEQTSDEESLKDLEEMRQNLEDKLNEWQSQVIELRIKGFQDALNWPSGINSEFFQLRNNLDTYDPTVPEGYKTRASDLEKDWDRIKGEWNSMKQDLEKFNSLYKSKDLPALEIPDAEEITN